MAFLTLLAAGCHDAQDCGPDGCCLSSFECTGGHTCDASGRCVVAPSCAAGCRAEDVCSPNAWCDTAPRIDPDRVALLGAVNNDPALLGAAPLDQPTRLIGAVYTASDSVIHRAAVDGLGRVLYLETFIDYSSGQAVLHRYVRRIVPDAWTWLGGWWWLWGPLRKNDELVPAPCEPTGMVGRPGTGDVYIGCPDGVVGPDGAMLVEGAEPVAVNEAGAVLAVRDGGLLVRTPAGALLPVSPSDHLKDVLAGRGFGDGFRIVALDPFGNVARRWTVSATGALGDGATFPPRSCEACQERTIDADGAIYRAFQALGPNNALVAGLERCEPGRCTQVYVPQSAVAGQDDPTVPPVRYLYPMPPLQCAISGP